MIDILKVESDLKKKENKIAVSFFLCVLSAVIAVVFFHYLPKDVAIIFGIIFSVASIIMLIRFLRLIRVI